HSKQKAMEDQRERSKQREWASYGITMTIPKNIVFDLLGSFLEPLPFFDLKISFLFLKTVVALLDLQ
ncbi:hypothetical protein, partial [Bacillus pseudomycoides]